MARRRGPGRRLVAVTAPGLRLRVERLVVGFCLVGLGTLWTLANLGRLDLLEALHTWWPVSLVFWGLLELGVAASGRRKERS